MLRKAMSEGLAVELAADGQVGRLSEEILACNRRSRLRILRRVVQIQSRHLEHLTGALTVASCDQGRVDIDEVLSPGRTCGWRRQSGNARGIRPGRCCVLGRRWVIVRMIFQAVAFLLKRIIRCGWRPRWRSLLPGSRRAVLLPESATRVPLTITAAPTLILVSSLEVCHGVVIYDLQGLKKSTVAAVPGNRRLWNHGCSLPSHRPGFLCLNIFLCL